MHFGYTTANVKVRIAPSLTAEVYDVLPTNTWICYKDYDEDWVSILSKIDGYRMNTFYMSSKYFSNKEVR